MYETARNEPILGQWPHLMTLPHSQTDVAHEAGFSGLRTFNRVFKETTGYTPRDYRETFRIKSKTASRSQ